MKRESYKFYHIIGSVLLAILLVPSVALHAQTPAFFTGNITGNIYQSGSLVGLGTGNADVSSPMTAHTTGIFNTLRFYYGTGILNTLNASPTTLTSSRVLGIGGLLGSGGDAYIQFRTNGNST